MSTFQKIFDWKTYIFTVIALVSFSSFLVVLFGQTIPGIIITFFKIAGDYVILVTVLIFAFTWFLKARPHNRPKNYRIVPLDVFGKKSTIDGIRTDFRGELFPGSKYLLAWADNLNELKTVCHCGRKATMVVRLDSDGKVVSDGEQVVIGGNNQYQSMCRRHFAEHIWSN
mgnify:CR=1 FL=1